MNTNQFSSSLIRAKWHSSRHLARCPWCLHLGAFSSAFTATLHFWTTGLNALTPSQQYNTQQLQSLLHLETWHIQQQLSTMHRATAITAYTLQHNSTPPHSSHRALTNNKLTTAAPHVLHINNELPHLWTSGVFGLYVLPFVFRATLHKAVIIFSYYGLYNHL